MKNLVVFEMPEDFGSCMRLDTCDYENHLFKECGTYQKYSSGFIKTVFGSFCDNLSGNIKILTVRTQKKVPEKSHVDHIVRKKIKSIVGDNTERQVTKDELATLKDEAVMEVLSKTFPKTPEDHIVFIRDNLIFVEANSYKKGHELLENLDKLVGGLPYSEMECVEGMAKLLLSPLQDPWTFGNSAKLVDLDERQITISKGDISCDITKDITNNGAELEFIELEYDSCMMCKIKPSLEVKSIKYSKDMLDEVESDKCGSTLMKINEVIRMFYSLKRVTNFD